MRASIKHVYNDRAEKSAPRNEVGVLFANCALGHYIYMYTHIYIHIYTHTHGERIHNICIFWILLKLDGKPKTFSPRWDRKTIDSTWFWVSFWKGNKERYERALQTSMLKWGVVVIMRRNINAVLKKKRSHRGCWPQQQEGGGWASPSFLLVPAQRLHPGWREETEPCWKAPWPVSFLSDIQRQSLLLGISVSSLPTHFCFGVSVSLFSSKLQAA